MEGNAVEGECDELAIELHHAPAELDAFFEFIFNEAG